MDHHGRHFLLNILIIMNKEAILHLKGKSHLITYQKLPSVYITSWDIAEDNRIVASNALVHVPFNFVCHGFEIPTDETSLILEVGGNKLEMFGCSFHEEVYDGPITENGDKVLYTIKYERCLLAS